jgi:hypothetical protein
MTNEIECFTIEELIHGKKLYQERARMALPLLVRQAKASHPIYYSDLAEELDIPNPRNLNYVLGAIGGALLELGKKWGKDVPPIQSLVIQKNSGLPGEGFNWFIKNKVEFEKATSTQKRKIINQMVSDVYLFSKWDDVLKEFGLPPVKNDPKLFSDLQRSKKDLMRKIQYGGRGESEAHLSLKNYLAENPTALKLSKKLLAGETEFLFPSADTIDILFKTETLWIGVEVKSEISNLDDIKRGLFQCVKYRALIEAFRIVLNQPPNVRVILALGGIFPQELRSIKNQLGVEVIDNIVADVPESPVHDA